MAARSVQAGCCLEALCRRAHSALSDKLGRLWLAGLAVVGLRGRGEPVQYCHTPTGAVALQPPSNQLALRPVVSAECTEPGTNCSGSTCICRPSPCHHKPANFSKEILWLWMCTGPASHKSRRLNGVMQLTTRQLAPPMLDAAACRGGAAVQKTYTETP